MHSWKPKFLTVDFLVGSSFLVRSIPLVLQRGHSFRPYLVALLCLFLPVLSVPATWYVETLLLVY